MVLLEVSGIAKVLPKQKLEAWLASSPLPAKGSPVIQNPGLGCLPRNWRYRQEPSLELVSPPFLGPVGHPWGK